MREQNPQDQQKLFLCQLLRVKQDCERKYEYKTQLMVEGAILRRFRNCVLIATH